MRCELGDLNMPENGERWSCDQPVVMNSVPRRTKCQLICRVGYTSMKGGRRRYHRCIRNEQKIPIWKEPENVVIYCEPTSTLNIIITPLIYFFREFFTGNNQNMQSNHHDMRRKIFYMLGRIIFIWSVE